MDLPPVPEHPELPPEVKIAGEEELLFRAADGVAIQALARVDAEPERVVVLCHPHPLYGGTMHNVIMVVVAKRLLEAGRGRAGWLRFNFRGVGQSEGKYDAGDAERLDVLAAIAEARRRAPRAKIAVVAYSFGTGPGHAAALDDGGIDRIALVAPSPRVLKDRLGEYRGPLEVFAAGKDNLATAEETATIAEQLGAKLHVLPEADHFFVRFRRDLANLVVSFVAPELAP